MSSPGHLVSKANLAATGGSTSRPLPDWLADVATALQKGANLSDIANAATALSNLGGLAKSSNLADLLSVSTARTNLGLAGAALLNVGTTAGTVAAGDDSRITGAAQKASNLSDLANATTARGNLGVYSTAQVDAIAALKANISGQAFTGAISAPGITCANGDISSYRSGGTTGVIFLNSAQTRYLYWDGTNYNMPGAGLYANGQAVLRDVGSSIGMPGYTRLSNGLVLMWGQNTNTGVADLAIPFPTGFSSVMGVVCMTSDSVAGTQTVVVTTDALDNAGFNWRGRVVNNGGAVGGVAAVGYYFAWGV
jgi:hypothetical protein